MTSLRAHGCRARRIVRVTSSKFFRMTSLHRALVAKTSSPHETDGDWNMRRVLVLLVVSIAALGALTSVRALAQSDARVQAQSDAKALAFEVASIKPNLARNVGVTGGCRGIDSRLAANDP